MENSGVLIGEALILGNDRVQQLLVHRQVGQRSQQPAITELALERVHRSSIDLEIRLRNKKIKVSAELF